MAKRVPTPTSDASEKKQKALIEFNVSRANAINEYASFELNLGHLFAHLVRAPGQQAFAAFAAIDGAQKRLTAIKRLLELAHGDEFEDFFESFSRLAVGLSATRNKVVHWIALTSKGAARFNPKKDLFLRRHPDIFSKERFYKHEIDDFTKKTRFISMLVFYFTLYLKHPAAGLDVVGAQHRPWRDIFHEGIRFPPPPDHPLRTLHERVQIQPLA